MISYRLTRRQTARIAVGLLRQHPGRHHFTTKSPLTAPPAVDQMQPEWFTSSPPDIAALNERIIAETEPTPKMFAIGMPEYREKRHTAFKHGDPARFSDVSFAGPEGAPDVAARIFFPDTKEASTPRGALLHLHGGGFTTGSAMGQNDMRLLRHASASNMAVVSVDYRLSPETVHPGPLLDCEAAALWLDSPAGRDAARISREAPLLMVGESAGGYLAAALLSRMPPARRRSLFAAVALTYGWFDMAETPYFKAWGERRLVETADELRWLCVRTASNRGGGSRRPTLGPRRARTQPLPLPRRGLPTGAAAGSRRLAAVRRPERKCVHGAAPPSRPSARAASRARRPRASRQSRCCAVAVPPCLFSVGTEDALLEDTLFMYARWLASGNAATMRVYPGAAHGMGHFGPHQFTEQGEQVLQAIDAFYAAHLPD